MACAVCMYKIYCRNFPPRCIVTMDWWLLFLIEQCVKKTAVPRVWLWQRYYSIFTPATTLWRCSMAESQIWTSLKTIWKINLTNHWCYTEKVNYETTKWPLTNRMSVVFILIFPSRWLWQDKSPSEKCSHVPRYLVCWCAPYQCNQVPRNNSWFQRSHSYSHLDMSAGIDFYLENIFLARWND